MYKLLLELPTKRTITMPTKNDRKYVLKPNARPNLSKYSEKKGGKNRCIIVSARLLIDMQYAVRQEIDSALDREPSIPSIR